MTKVAQRLLVFFIGLPIIIGIVSLHYYNHIALNIIVVVVSALSANEFYNMASKRFELFPKTTTIIFTAALPFIAYNFVLTDVDLSYLTWILVFAIFAFMCAESLCGKSFEKSLEKIAVTILIIFYCGFMLTFISRMCSIKEDSTIFIYLFFILVFILFSGIRLYDPVLPDHRVRVRGGWTPNAIRAAAWPSGQLPPSRRSADPPPSGREALFRTIILHS